MGKSYTKENAITPKSIDKPKYYRQCDCCGKTCQFDYDDERLMTLYFCDIDASENGQPG